MAPVAPQKIPLGTPPAEVSGRFVVLAPGEAAPLLAFELPAGVTGQSRRRIAARQLVDRLGPGAEGLEIHPLGGGAWTRAVVVASDAAAEWRRDPLVSDRRCSGLWPDYLALPAAPELAVAEAEGDRVRLRIGIDDGLSAPASLLGPLLDRALSGASVRAAVVLGDADAPALLRRLEAAGLPVVRGVEGLADLGLAPPDVVEPDRLDLRADPNREGERLSGELALWSVPAGLLLLAVGLWSAATMTETRALRAEAGLLRQETVERLRQGLIPQGPILDVRAQVAQARAGQGTPDPASDPIVLLRSAAETLAAAGASVQTVALERDGSLSVTLVAADFLAVDRLVEALARGGLSAETASARAGEAGVEARIVIAGGEG